MNDHFAGRLSVVLPHPPTAATTASSAAEGQPGEGQTKGQGRGPGRRHRRIMHQGRSGSTSIDDQPKCRDPLLVAQIFAVCTDLDVQFSAGVPDGSRERDLPPGRRPFHVRKSCAPSRRARRWFRKRRCPRTPRASRHGSVPAGGPGRSPTRRWAMTDRRPNPSHTPRTGDGPCPAAGAVGRKAQTRLAPPTVQTQAAQRWRSRSRAPAPTRRGQPRNTSATASRPTTASNGSLGRRCRSIARRARSCTASPTQTRPAPANGISSATIARW